MQCAKLCNAQNCAIWHSFALYMGIALCTVLNKIHNLSEQNTEHAMHNSIVTVSNAVSAPVVVLVADPVAAVVTRGVAEPGCVVGVLGCGEVLGVQTKIVSTLGPSRVSTVRI